jgi:phospholipid:diacylglycerol acyltransferase
MWIKVIMTMFSAYLLSNSDHIQGGNAVWGNATHAPDDEDDASHTHGELVTFRSSQFISVEGAGDTTGNMTAEEAGAWILQHTPSAFQACPI